MEHLKLENIKTRYAGRRIGFKATERDMTCRKFQYKMNETFILGTEIMLGFCGFHFCNRFTDIYSFYPNNNTYRFFIIEYGKNYITDGGRSVTDEITFLEEIDPSDFIEANLGGEVSISDMREVIKHQSLKEDFLRKIISMKITSFKIISHHQILTENFIRDFKNDLCWFNITMQQTLSEAFIREHKNFIDWDSVARYQTLSEDFIKEFKDLLSWVYVCEYQTLSEEFIEANRKRVKWYIISFHQKLSEDFIRRNSEYVSWVAVSYKQKLSIPFIQEFKNELKSQQLLESKHYSYETKLVINKIINL